MSRSKKAAIKAIMASTGIATLTELATALASIGAGVATILATVPYGAMYRPTSGGHVNKRGYFVAAITATVAGDGTFDTLRATARALAVPAFRAEVQYAIATGDVGYFRARKGGWCSWARPLLKGDALDPEVTDDALATAFAATCPMNPANVGGMLAEITLASARRAITPLPVFADAVKAGRVTAFDPDTHGADGYQSQGYGHAVYTR